MADLKLMDVVQVLADEIGPRPTGTEEEQRAALTIQQWFTNEAGRPAAIEEVEGEPELDTARFFCYAVAFIVTLLAFIMKFLALPAIVFSLAAAAVVALESLGHPVLTRFLKKGISQNVVAVYEPETMPTAEDRRNGQKVRKIVLVAHYDSQRLRADTNGGLARIAVLAQKIEFWALIATPVILLIRYLFFYNNTGIINSIFSVVVAVLLVIMGLYLLKAIARRFAKYNDAANCNASGVAVLLDIAQRVNGSHVRKTRTRRHGARAAAAAAPEGATLDYETEATEADDFDAAVVGAIASAGAASRDDVYAVSDAITATETAAVSANPAEWRGRATNQSGYALAENVEVFSRGAAPAPRGTLGLGNNPDVVSTTRAVRVESGEQSYASTNPALASARAALQASRSIPADEHMHVLQGDVNLPHSEKTHRPFSAAEMSTGLGVRDIQYTTRPRRGSAAEEEAEIAASAPVSASASVAQAPTEVPSYAAIPASRYSAAAVAPTVGGNTSFADVLATVGYSERSADQHIDESVMDAVASGEMTAQEAHAVLSATAPAVVAAELDFQAANTAPVAAPEPVAAAPVSAPAPAPTPEPAKPAIPDWYARAKANSRRTEDVIVARSTFADALDQANESTVYTNAVSAATPVAAPAAPAAPAPVSTVAAYAAAPAVTAEDLAAHEDFLVAQRAQAAAAAAASVAALEAAAAQQEALVQEAPAPQTDPIQAATGFAAALAAAQEAEERKLADGTMTLSPASTGSFSVTLPEVATTMPQLTMADSAQRAPLAEAATSGQAAAKSLLTMLPSISLDNPEDTPAPAATAAAAPAAKSPLAGLASLPGFDDVPGVGAAAAAPAASAPAAAPAPAPAPAPMGYGLAGMTGTFASVSADLLQGPGADDMFVDDADDSAFAQNFTAAGAFAGPSYMDMPTKKGLFGFGKKKRRQQEEAMAEAAAAAAAQAAAGFAEGYDEFDDGYTGGYAPRGWNGGAFSLKNAFKRKKGQEEFDEFGGEEYAEDGYGEGYDPAYDQNDEYDFAPVYSQGFNQGYDYDAADGYGDAGYGQGYGYDAAGYGYGYGTDATAGYGYEGYGADAYGSGTGAFDGAAYGTDDFAYMPEAQNGVAELTDSYDAYDAGNTDAADAADDFAAETAPVQSQEKDLKQIFDFRDANISAEVWFVALGSESPNNSGMRAFLDAHGSELRNAIFVELEGMGAGDLCLTTAEGKYRKLNVSSRVRRMVQKAQEVMGIRVGECTYCIDNSATYHAMLRGMQSMHLVGSDGAKPALQNQANDVCANIDEGKLRRNADFVMELVRSF